MPEKGNASGGNASIERNDAKDSGNFCVANARAETRFSPHFARQNGLEMSNLHFKPAPPLSRFVEMLWYYQHPPRTHQKERLMPDGCSSLVINLEQDETRIYDADNVKKLTKLSGCSVVGPHSKCFVIDTDEQTCVIGVCFRPAGAVPFLKLPSDELQNQHVDLEYLWGRLARELRERALAAKTPEAKVRVVELALLERAAGMFDGQPVVEYAVENFLLRPAATRITDVAGKPGLASGGSSNYSSSTWV
jgi:hypothetical protein